MPRAHGDFGIIAASFAAVLIVAASSQLLPANLTTIAGDFAWQRGRLVATVHSAVGFTFALTVLLWGALNERWDHKWVFWIALLFACAGALASALASRAWMIVAGGALIAASTAGVETTVTTLMGELRPRKRALFINLSQAMFAIGAGGSPFAVVWLLNRGFSWPMTFVAAAAAVAGLLVLLPLARSRPAQRRAEPLQLRRALGLMTQPRFTLLVATISFYVGIEIGVSALSPQYFEEVWRIPTSDLWAKLPISAFWLAMVPGRVLAGALACRLGEPKVACGALLLGALSQSLFLTATGPTAGLLWIAVSGFALGGVWPTVLSSVSLFYREFIPTRLALLIGAGGAAIAVFEAFLGLLYDFASATSRRNGIFITFCVIPAFAVVALLSYILFLRAARRGDASPEELSAPLQQTAPTL
ncbi:MAG: MFS transporter [Planctomycetota bacterium]